MKIAYLEDMAQHRAEISAKIQAWIRDNSPNSSLSVFPDAESFLFALEDQSFDLLLLDILMPGLDGVSLASKLRQSGNDCLIVFITGEPDFVFSGYKVSALDYLLKPISDQDLCQVLNRAWNKLSTAIPRLILETRSGQVEAVRADLICAIEVNQKILIYTVKRPGNSYQDLEVRSSLNQCLDQLAQAKVDHYFIQVHRSYICALAEIKRIDQNTVELSSGQRLPLARSRRPEVLARYLEFRKGLAQSKQGASHGPSL